MSARSPRRPRRSSTVSSRLHLFQPDGDYDTGYGRIRTELEEIELIRRYSGGILAEAGGGYLLHAQRTPFRLLRLSRDEMGSLNLEYDREQTEVVEDYALEMSERLPSGTWKWKWRHPSLVGLLPVDDCVIASVLMPEAVEVQTLADFNTDLWFLDERTGQVLRKETVSGVFAPVAMRRDKENRYRFLMIRLDPTTGVLYPAQYSREMQ